MEVEPVDSIDLDDHILEDEIDENEIFEPLDPLPLLENANDNTGNAAGEEAADTAKEERKERKKRTTQIAVLNEKRLLSENGVRALPSFFENVKFKGKGHEASDLKLLLRKYEFWAQSLFPKQRFEDVASKVEELCSHKKAIKREINDMRLGINTGTGDDVSRRIDDATEEPMPILNDSGDLAAEGEL